MDQDAATRLREATAILATPEPGESKASALRRVARLLEVTDRTAQALRYGKVAEVSQRRAEEILAREPDALRMRLAQLRAEQERIRARLEKIGEGEHEWGQGSGASSVRPPSGQLSDTSAHSRSSASASRSTQTEPSTSATEFEDRDLMHLAWAWAR